MPVYGQLSLDSILVTTPPASTPAVAGTVDIEHVAQHESGHAAAFWALGIAFDRLAMNGSHGPAVYPSQGTKTKRSFNWVIQACGVIADQQARGLSMRGSQIVQLILGGRGERFETDDAATGQVAVRPYRGPAVMPGGDLNDMATFFASMPRLQASPEIVRIWREAERFAEELRPAIDALAAAVLGRGELSYAEVSDIASAAMGDRPVPVLAEWLG
jgi:hypothetical protein